jgi:hypothetical protein
MRRPCALGSFALAPLALVAALVLAPRPASGLDYDESIDGDILSNDELAPTPIGVLEPDLNVIAGNVFWNETGFDGDKLSVTVPPGREIEAITLEISSYLGAIPTATRVFETPVFEVIEVQSPSSDGIYAFTAPPFPLPPGDYGFTTTFVGGDQPLPGSYDCQWTIRVPEPAPAVASLAAAAVLFTVARSRARRTDRSG